VGGQEKYVWECKGVAICGELLKEADHALKKAQEQEAAKMWLKIYEDIRDKLVNLGNIMHVEAGDKTRWVKN
jgi:hypothetical protein